MVWIKWETAAAKWRDVYCVKSIHWLPLSLLWLLPTFIAWPSLIGQTWSHDYDPWRPNFPGNLALQSGLQSGLALHTWTGFINNLLNYLRLTLWPPKCSPTITKNSPNQSDRFRGDRSNILAYIVEISHIPLKCGHPRLRLVDHPKPSSPWLGSGRVRSDRSNILAYIVKISHIPLKCGHPNLILDCSAHISLIGFKLTAPCRLDGWPSKTNESAV